MLQTPSALFIVKKYLKLFSYSACIRRAAGYCCVQYQQCAGIPAAFSLDTQMITLTGGFTDSYCTYDYVIIPGT
jgi:hypothetical protein